MHETVHHNEQDAPSTWSLRLFVVLGVMVALAAATVATAWADPRSACPAGFNCLPAWRWVGNSDRWLADFGSVNPWSEALAQAGATLPALFFSLSKIIWQVLLWALRFAMSNDFLNADVQDTIHENFYGMAEWVTSGFGPILFIIAVAAVITSVARKQTGFGGKLTWVSLIRPATCFALLFFMMWASNPDEHSDFDSNAGSPGWFINLTQDLTSYIGGFLADGSSAFVERPDDYADGSLTGCNNMIESMYAWGDRSPPVSHLTSSNLELSPAEEEIRSQALPVGRMVSTIWEVTYLEQWTNAQFGETRAGRRAACHLQEYMNGGFLGDFNRDLVAVRADDDGNLVHAATRPTAPAFGYWNGIDDKRRELIALGACNFQGSSAGDISMYPEWEYFDDADDVPEYCAELLWGEEGDRDRVTSNGDPFFFRFDGSIGRAFSGPSSEAETFIRGLDGESISTGTSAGLVSILVAVVYLLSLGGLAVGAVVAQFGALAFAVVFPLVLLLGMWPTPQAGSRFTKAVRFGVGMLFARLVFVTLLSIMLVMTRTFIEVIQQLNAAVVVLGDVGIVSGLAYTGINSGFTHAFPPLVSVYIYKRMSKELGFANPTSLKGSTGLVANIANKAQDMQSHSPSSAMSRAKYRMNPMSPYGPLSYRRGLRGIRKTLEAGGGKGGKKPKDGRPDGDGKGVPDGAVASGKSSDDTNAKGDKTKAPNADDVNGKKGKKDEDGKKGTSGGTRGAGRNGGASAGGAAGAVDPDLDPDFDPDLDEDGEATPRRGAKVGRAAKAVGRGAVRAARWGWGADKARPNMLNRAVRVGAVAGGAGVLFGGGLGAAAFGGLTAPLAGVVPGLTGMATSAGAAVLPGAVGSTVGSVGTMLGANMVAAPGIAGLGGFQGLALGYGGYKMAGWARRSGMDTVRRVQQRYANAPEPDQGDYHPDEPALDTYSQGSGPNGPKPLPHGGPEPPELNAGDQGRPPPTGPRGNNGGGLVPPRGLPQPSDTTRPVVLHAPVQPLRVNGAIPLPAATTQPPAPVSEPAQASPATQTSAAQTSSTSAAAVVGSAAGGAALAQTMNGVGSGTDQALVRAIEELTRSNQQVAQSQQRSTQTLDRNTQTVEESVRASSEQRRRADQQHREQTERVERNTRALDESKRQSEQAAEQQRRQPLSNEPPRSTVKPVDDRYK